MLKPEEWKQLAVETGLHDSTMVKLAQREHVRSDIRRRVEAAAGRCGIVLPRGFFAKAPQESAA